MLKPHPVYQYATKRRPPVRLVECECCKDLVGKRRGHLVALGVTRPHNKLRHQGAPKLPPRWVVQCDCGAYDLRRRRTLHGRENMDDECGFCSARKVEWRRDFFAKHGRHPDYLDMMEAGL